MAEDKIRIPSSGGGLVRYFEDFKSKIQFTPTAILVVIIIVIIVEIYLYKTATI